ncbi:tetratricopeptide repeat protein [Oxalobacteraceae bacterium CAVE-383]|nr:tetratricopeptide repeat protein [Oxalobacteraceae bacterium CAVE-383]
MLSNALLSQLKSAYALHEAGQQMKAKDAGSKVLAEAPSNFDALKLMGFIAGGENDFAAAADYLARAVRVKPDFVEGWYYLATSHLKLNDAHRAIACFEAAIKLYPKFFEARHDLGLALASVNQFDRARQAFDAACAIRPDSAEAWLNLGIALGKLGKYPAEIACCRKVLQLAPAHAVAAGNLATALLQDKQFEEAIAAYRDNFARGLEIDFARGNLVYAQLHAGAWDRIAADIADLHADIQAGKNCVEPFVFAAISDSPAEQMKLALQYAAAHYPAQEPALADDFDRIDWTGAGKIRIAYLSADFHAHATAILMLEIFRRHDRARFQVVGISFGPDDGSDLRNEIVAAFDEFIDVRGLNDADAAALIRSRDIAIAVDLKGYTAEARPGILAYRPAPIQVNYLGHPATMGAGYIDYLIADRFTVPPQEEMFYTESIALMPDTYQANGRNRQPAKSGRARGDYGLPADAFVFCSFNNPYKNNPCIFAVWMSLLEQLPRSVLWLLGNPVLEKNLRLEAARRGIASERLIFAPRVSQADYLERLAHADLFLDSLPYGAHTTASDALWMNVPVITCVGSAFPGRVGQSILHAIDLPELIAHSLDEYRELALSYALDPGKLAALREKLRRHADSAPLFDAARFTRNLETLYEKMAGNHRSGAGRQRIAI